MSQNICGEWYFPWHSHALNEFANFDEGSAAWRRCCGSIRAAAASPTRPRPPSRAPTQERHVPGLGVDDANYYQLNPKTTTRTTATTAGQTTNFAVASASGFPATGSYYVRVDNEVMQVTGGQGTTTWTVARGQLGTPAASHLANATVTALANDWYAGFTGVPAGSQA